MQQVGCCSGNREVVHHFEACWFGPWPLHFKVSLGNILPWVCKCAYEWLLLLMSSMHVCVNY